MPLTDISPLPKIDLLLPSKERFTAKNAGAISGVVRDLVMSSTASAAYRIVGTAVDTPLECPSFLGVTPASKWSFKGLFKGTNIATAAAYLRAIASGPTPSMIEVHSRCHVAKYIAKKRPDIPVVLYLHNDPRDMKGAKTSAERAVLLVKLAGVICVSDYIKGCFLDGLDKTVPEAKKVGVARNGAERWLSQQPEKQPFILLAGRMVPEKGILECATAIATVLAKYPEWKLVIAGARRFEEAARGSYEEKIAKAIAPLGDRAEMRGFIPIEHIRELQATSAISACPSLWDDPMPKAVLEGLAAGCALLTTRRGGIPEAAEGRAHIVDDPTIQSFTAALEQMIGDDTYRKSLQDKAWNDFPFPATKMAHDADLLRAKILTAKL